MDPETRNELEATLAARAELGPSHDDDLIEGFLERVEARLADRRSGKGNAIGSHATAGMRFALTVTSLIAGIPITAIALTQGGLLALAVAWAGIVLVNLLFARGD